MVSTELFDREAPFQQFCTKNPDLVRVCIRKKTCEEFRACVRSTVERWRKKRLDPGTQGQGTDKATSESRSVNVPSPS